RLQVRGFAPELGDNRALILGRLLPVLRGREDDRRDPEEDQRQGHDDEHKDFADEGHGRIHQNRERNGTRANPPPGQHGPVKVKARRREPLSSGRSGVSPSTLSSPDRSWQASKTLSRRPQKSSVNLPTHPIELPQLYIILLEQASKRI